MGTNFEETEASTGKDQIGQVSALMEERKGGSQGRAVTFAAPASSGAADGDKGSRYPFEWACGRADSSGTTQNGGKVDFELKTRRRSTEHPNRKRQGGAAGRAAVAVSPLLDDLPSSRPALEGRINYHISRLERLKVRLADLNTSIEQEVVEYQVCAANLQRQGMGLSVLDLDRQLAGLRSARDGLKPSVAFHRGELVRIACKRLQMDREQGYGARLPRVYDTLDGDEAWEARFAP
ncbi:hypothetical protein DV737_g4999, partial [Chaetothyriales sp. CBS 132003]